MFYNQYLTYYYMTFSILHYTLIAGEKFNYLKAVLWMEFRVQFSKLICKRESITNKKRSWISTRKYFCLIKSFCNNKIFFKK